MANSGPYRIKRKHALSGVSSAYCHTLMLYNTALDFAIIADPLPPCDMVDRMERGNSAETQHRALNKGICEAPMHSGGI